MSHQAEGAWPVKKLVPADRAARLSRFDRRSMAISAFTVQEQGADIILQDYNKTCCLNRKLLVSSLAIQ